MPPLPLSPNQPSGLPDWYSPSGPPSWEATSRASSSSASGGNRLRITAGQYGPVVLPSEYSDEDAQAYITAYDQYIGRLDQMWQQSSGLQRKQIEAQISDAQKARENEMTLGRLQADTSRYGVDERRKTEIDQLLENRRQFDASHALEMEKLGIDRERLGLDRAKTATDFLSSPDRFAQGAAFLDLSGRVLADQPGAGTYGRDVTPRPNTMADFSVLESGGDPYANRGSAMPGSGAGASSGADARVKALKAAIDAAPPSSGPGMTGNDYAVMNVARSLYSMNLNPQQQAAIGSSKEYQSILGSEGRALGRNPEDWWQRQQQSLPGQGSARLA
jgi:hypothetical protein